MAILTSKIGVNGDFCDGNFTRTEGRAQFKRVTAKKTHFGINVEKIFFLI